MTTCRATGTEEGTKEGTKEGSRHGAGSVPSRTYLRGNAGAIEPKSRVRRSKSSPSQEYKDHGGLLVLDAVRHHPRPVDVGRFLEIWIRGAQQHGQ